MRAELEVNTLELVPILLKRLVESKALHDVVLTSSGRSDVSREAFSVKFSAKTEDTDRIDLHDAESARAHIEAGARDPFQDASGEVPRHVAWRAETTPIEQVVVVATIATGTNGRALVRDQHGTGWMVRVGDAVGSLSPPTPACQWIVTHIDLSRIVLARADARACSSSNAAWTLVLAPSPSTKKILSRAPLASPRY